MQRKAYVPGVAVLLAALLTACTSSDDGDATDDSRPGDAAATASPAQPGRYDTLPVACGSVGQETLDSLLPGIEQLTDADQRKEAYKGEATQTYDTDRKAGCRWKAESTDATDRLFVDFERVMSYENPVSDDSKAEEVYGTKEEAADLPQPTATDSAAEEQSTAAGEGDASPSKSSAKSSSGSASGSPSSSPSASATPASLQPRILDDLGDEAFLDDVLGTSGQRTVTVVFRTSNVIVTVEYEEQPATTTAVPDSEEMQDRARNLAERLAESFEG
ncbi:hypothetical protein SGFS_069520 [Streptomyces graminofaciens]|uniref:Secreted serine-rich protein n=1 Tax=Streptomyces graminofaciens TaxID=68212 RepID=A0ABM7FHU9_9ACTN|nr:DUF3558 domain-containing protein [Streptomyces graminofaciens]BBC35658.1 hypothetical protein SGFS_069520 [Streptomyces graminofaciens]